MALLRCIAPGGIILPSRVSSPFPVLSVSTQVTENKPYSSSATMGATDRATKLHMTARAAADSSSSWSLSPASSRQARIARSHCGFPYLF